MRDERFIKSVISGLEELEGLKVTILTHAGGDPDSVCAAIVLKRILREAIGTREECIWIPDTPTAHVKAILRYFAVEPSDCLETADAYLVVDAGSPEQLGDCTDLIKGDERTVIVLDHHSDTVSAFPPNVRVYSNESYQSLCEIVYDLSEALGLTLNMREVEALVVGIYYDTVRLSVADMDTSLKVCRLVSRGVDMSKILSRLEHEMDISERVARLKGASRMRIYRVGEWLLALTSVGKFQSSVARSLVMLGAHLAIAVGEAEEGYVRGSLRASQDFVEKSKINLGVDLARKVGAELGGHGGGHASASHLVCKSSVEDVFERILNEVARILGQRPEVIVP